MNYPVKSIRLESLFIYKQPKKYEVTLTGTEGYGIDYGVIDCITDKSIVCSEEHLGQTVLDLLISSPRLWEDSIIKVRQL